MPRRCKLVADLVHLVRIWYDLTLFPFSRLVPHLVGAGLVSRPPQLPDRARLRKLAEQNANRAKSSSPLAPAAPS